MYATFRRLLLDNPLFYTGVYAGLAGVVAYAVSLSPAVAGVVAAVWGVAVLACVTAERPAAVAASAADTAAALLDATAACARTLYTTAPLAGAAAFSLAAGAAVGLATGFAGAGVVAFCVLFSATAATFAERQTADAVRWTIRVLRNKRSWEAMPAAVARLCYLLVFGCLTAVAFAEGVVLGCVLLAAGVAVAVNLLCGRDLRPVLAGSALIGVFFGVVSSAAVCVVMPSAAAELVVFGRLGAFASGVALASGVLCAMWFVLGCVFPTDSSEGLDGIVRNLCVCWFGRPMRNAFGPEAAWVIRQVACLTPLFGAAVFVATVYARCGAADAMLAASFLLAAAAHVVPAVRPYVAAATAE